MRAGEVLLIQEAEGGEDEGERGGGEESAGPSGTGSRGSRKSNRDKRECRSCISVKLTHKSIQIR